MPVPGDQHGRKTCLQVYNPAGFSIEFAMIRSSPQRFDCVHSIVVWCGVPPHRLQREIKCRAPSNLAFRPNGPAVAMDDPLHQADADTRTRKLLLGTIHETEFYAR